MEESGLCVRCSASVTATVFFCPTCGAAQVAALLASTTANYDPGAPDFKPWREVPSMGSQRPMLPPSTVASVAQAKPSWKPTMKQPAKALKKKGKGGKAKDKGEGVTLVGEDASNASSSMAGSSHSSAASVAGRVTGVVYFKQLAFQRRGGQRMVASTRRRHTVAEHADQPVVIKAPEEVTLIHPLAVYDASWLTTPGYTVHVSLVDRAFKGGAENSSRFFLRVGVVREPALGVADLDPDARDSCTLQVLEVLQNDSGKLLTPPLQYWVDLGVIQVDEYYMGVFLQQSFRHIAHRVQRHSRCVSSLLDQVCLVEAVRETAESETIADVSEDAMDDFDAEVGQSGGRPRPRVKARNGQALGRLIAVITDQPVTRSQRGPGLLRHDPGTAGSRSPSRSQALSPVSSPPSTLASLPPTASSSLSPNAAAPALTLDKTIAQRTVRVPIGAIYEGAWVLCSVRLSLRYPDPEHLMQTPLPFKREAILAVTPITHVILHVFPFYYNSHSDISTVITKIGPKIISFEVQSLEPLLGFGPQNDVPSMPTDDEGQESSHGGGSVDAIAKQGSQAISQLLVKLGRLLCFRVDGAGNLRLGVVGAASLAAKETTPISDAVDGDQDEDEDAEADQDQKITAALGPPPVSEGEVARRLRQEAIAAHAKVQQQRSEQCVYIQSLWRRALARGQVKRLKHKHRHAVPIQCLARRIIAKARARSQRLQIALEDRKKTVLDSAEAWAPTLLSNRWCPTHKASQCPCTHHACTLESNDVDLYCHFESLLHPSNISDKQIGITVVDHEDPELSCKCSVHLSDLEHVASALLHNLGDDFLAPSEALQRQTSTSQGREQLLAALSQGVRIVVLSRQMEFMKAMWSLHDVSTTFGVYEDDDGDLFVGI